jgi:DNA-binding NarL/FixJ family response regulator
MIVDDQEMVRNGLMLFLDAFDDFESAGEAANGESAVHMVAKNRPDVILMDLIMSPMNGVDATKIIHRKHPGVPIIAMSASEDPAMRQEAMDAGAVGFLSKSISLENLAKALRKAQGGSS